MAQRGSKQDLDARKLVAFTASNETTGRINYENFPDARGTAETPISIGRSWEGLISTESPVGNHSNH